jgi:drug/metabolite transporter (DMT)-like permease
VTELPRLRDDDAPHRRPWLGYVMVLSAAVLFAINGVVAKVILDTGLSSLRLTQVRLTGAAVVLVAVLAIVRPDALRVQRRELAFLAAFGIFGLAFVQWLYLFAIHRLELGVALLLQYLAPLLVALWARFVVHRPVRRRLWLALALSLSGLTLVVQVWRGTDTGLSGVGVAAALTGAVAFAAYILLAEHGIERRDAVSLTTWGFVFGAFFFALIQPWWRFPRSSSARCATSRRRAPAFWPCSSRWWRRRWRGAGWMNRSRRRRWPAVLSCWRESCSRRPRARPKCLGAVAERAQAH